MKTIPTFLLSPSCLLSSQTQKKENILHSLWPEAQHDGKALPCPCGPRSSRLPFFSKTTTEGKAKARYKMENPAHSQSVHITKVFFPPVSRKLQRCKANWEPLTGSLGTEIIRAELQRSPPPLLRGFKFACILKGAALICQGCLGPSPGRPRPEQLLSREEGGGCATQPEFTDTKPDKLHFLGVHFACR